MSAYETLNDANELNRLAPQAGIASGNLRAFTGERAITKEEQQRYQLIHETRNSLERIETALRQCGNGGSVSQLLKSDIDNAAKHSLRVAKNLREMKKLLFPTAPKEKTAEEKTPDLYEKNGATAQTEQ